MTPWTRWSPRLWPDPHGAALARAAAEWRQTFDAIDAPILVFDAQGAVVRLNATAQRLLGLEFKDLLGRTVDSIAPWEPWRTVAELAREAATSGAALARHARGERGKEWHVSASFVPGSTGAERRVIVLARDVTEVVRLEASLRRVEAVAQLGALVSGVAHEVRNPLFAISATVDALEAAAGRADLGPFAATLRGEVERLGRLMRDLLEFGKPAALELQEADIGEVVAGALRSVERIARERQVPLHNLVAPRLARVTLDPLRVSQVVQNLAQNALQVSPAGAPVEVSGAVSDGGELRRVEIEVADRGPGFGRADLDRIFEPFFTRRPGGTGLGLAIVRRLVEDHGGAVEARNRAGGGAVVRFWLPAPHPGPGRGDAQGEASPG